MDTLLNFRIQKRFVLYALLLVITTVFISTWLQHKIEEQVQQTVVEHITKEATKESLEAISRAVDVEVWNRLKNLPLDEKVLAKLLQDIIGIQVAENNLPDCNQYVLKVLKSGMFPVLQSVHGGRPEIKDWIWLNVGDVWRYGATAFNKEKRYPGSIFFTSKDESVVLTVKELEYSVQYNGTMMEVLIEEKIKIYTYSILPECIARVNAGGKYLIKSPGNKTYK